MFLLSSLIYQPQITVLELKLNKATKKDDIKKESVSSLILSISDFSINRSRDVEFATTPANFFLFLGE